MGSVQRSITESPRLHPGTLFGSTIAGGLFREFYGKDAVLFYFGRGALWHAVRSMKLSGSDTILVPAYHCGVEVEAILAAGAQVRFYDVTEDMTVDESDLRKKIDRTTRGLLLIHYFGFPQKIEALKTLCRSAGITLIEDCSHALFSCHLGQPLGTFGDIAIFSQRKTLPLPDGGALIVNAPARAQEVILDRPREYVALKKVTGMLIRSMCPSRPQNSLPYPLELLADAANRLISKWNGGRYSTGITVDSDRCRLAMSGISEQIMNRTRISQVIQRRRDNYIHLLREFVHTPGMKIIRDQLPDGVCPLFFPIIIDGERAMVLNHLLRSAIQPFIFGADLHRLLPGNQFANAERFSRHLLCLPVHQDLTKDDLTHMTKVILQSAENSAHAPAR